MGNVEVLRVATRGTSSLCRLKVSEIRADIMLVEGDPFVDIVATENFRGVWCYALEVFP